MSNSVDNRVVSMEFDNAQFEKNVAQSLETLKHLDKSLDGLTDSAKKFDGVSFEDIANGVNSLASRFTFFGNLTQTVFREISQDIVDLGKKMAKFSTQGLEDGWGKYADKTSSVQTIMSATGREIEFVEEQLERLNRFSDETSYSFTDMTSNIAKFTSQGIELDAAVTQMQGIATWGASAGANVQEVSRAMYNISQAMGVGAMHLIDWKSIQNANMATKEFKEQAMEAAVRVGTLKKENDKFVTSLGNHEVTIQNFTETLKDDWFDTKTMSTVFENYGKFADLVDEVSESTGLEVSTLLSLSAAEKEGARNQNDWNRALAQTDLTSEQLEDQLKKLNAEEYAFSRKTYEAAQQARTFSDAIAATRDAVGSAWMDVFQAIFGNYEQQRVLWTDMANWLWRIFASPVRSLQYTLEDVMKGTGKVAKVSKTFQEILGGTGLKADDYGGILTKVLKKSGMLSDEMIKDAGDADKAILGITGDTDKLRATITEMLKDNSSGTKDALELMDDYKKIAKEIWEGKWGNGNERKDKLEEAGYHYETAQLFAEYLHEGIGATEKDLWRLGDTAGKLTAEQIEALTKLQKAIDDGIITADDFRDAMEYDYSEWTGWDLLFGKADDKRGALYNFMDAVDNIRTSIGLAFEDVFGATKVQAIRGFLESINKVSKKILNLTTNLDKTRGIFKGLFAAFSIGNKAIKLVTGTVKAFFKELVPTNLRIGSLLSGIGELIFSFNDWLDDNHYVNKAINAATKSFKNLKDQVKPLSDSFKNLWKSFKDVKLLESLGKSISKLFKGGNISIGEVFKPLGSLLNKAATGLSKIVDNASAFVKTRFPEYINKIDDFFDNLSFGQVAVAFARIKDGVRSFIDSLKELFRTGDTKQFFASLKEQFSGVIDKVKGAYDVIKGLFSGGSFSSVFSSIKASYDSILSKVTNVFASIKAAFTEGDFTKIFDAFGEKFGKTLEKVTSVVNSLIDFFKTGNITSVFDSIRENFSGTIEKIVNFYNTYKDIIINIFKSSGKSAAASLTGISPIFDKIIQSLTELADKAKETVQRLKEAFEASSFGKILMPLIDKIGQVKEAIGGFFKGLDPAKSEALTTLASGLMSLIAALKLLKVAKIAGKGFTEFLTMVTGSVKTVSDTITTVVKSIGQVVSGIGAGIKQFTTDMFNSINSVIKMYKAKARVNNILKIAAAIAILAGALFLLAQIPEDKIERAGLALAQLAGVLALVTLIIGVASKIAGETGMAKAAFAILSFSAAVLILIGAIKMLDSIDGPTFAQNFVKLLGIMTLLTIAIAVIATAAGGKGKAATVNMLGFALGILVMVVALKQIQENLQGVSLEAFELLVVLCVLLAGLTWILRGVKLGSALGLVLIATSLVIIQQAIRKAMAEAIPPGEFESYWASFAHMAGMLVALSVAARVTGGVFKVLGLIILAEALVAIQKAIRKAMQYAIPVEEFTSYWGSFLEIIALFAAMFGASRLAGKGTLKAAALMIAFLVVIKLTTTLMKQLGKIDEAELKQGLDTILCIGLMYVAMLGAVAAIGDAKKSPVASIVLVLLTLIGLFGVLIYLTTIPTDKLIPAVIACATVLVGLALVFKAIASVGKREMNWQGVAAITVAVLAIAGIFAALVYAANYVQDTTKLLAVCAAFAIVALSLAFSLKIIQNNKSTWESAGSTAILVLVAALSMLPIAGALKMISGQDPLSLVAAAVAIGIVMLALAASMKIMQNNKSTWESVKATAALVLAAAISTIPIAFALKQLNGMNWSTLLAGAVSIGIIFMALTASISKLANAELSSKDKIISAAVGLGLALAAIIVVFGILAIVGAACKDVDASANALTHGAEMIGFAIGAFIGSIAEGMFAHAEGIADSLVSFVDKIVPAIEKLNEVPDDAMEKVSKLTNALTALASAELKNAFANLINGLLGETSDSSSMTDKFAQFGLTIRSLVDQLKTLDEADINKAASITSAVAALLGAMPKEGGKLDWLLGSKSTGMDNLKESLGKFAEGLTGAVPYFKALTEDDVSAFARASEITKIISEFPIGNGGGFLQKILGSESGAMDTIGASLVTFGQKLRSAAIWFNALTDDDLDSFKRAKEVTDVINQMSVGQGGGFWQKLAGSESGGMDTIGASLVTFAQKLRSAAAEFRQLSDDDIDAFDRAKEIMDKFGLIVPTASDNTAQATSQLPDAATNVANTDNILSGIDTAAMKDKFGDVKDVVTSFAGSGEGTTLDLSGITNALTDLPNIAETGVDGLIEAFTSKTGEAGSAGQAFGDSFVNALTNIAAPGGSASQAGSDVAASGVTGLSSHNGEAESAGGFFGDGFVNGILSRLEDVKTAAGTLGSAAAEALAAAEKAASPSKVTTELGKYFSQGFVKGISNGFHSVKSISEEMGNVASNALSNASYLIDDILNSDGQPTITPVLDLSEVRKEAQSLGSLGTMSASVSASRANAISGLRQSIELDRNQNGSSTSNNSYSNVINVYATPNQSVNEIADAVERRMVLKQKQRTVAFAR